MFVSAVQIVTPVHVQVQVRTRTPTGVQLDTMDLDKLFDITN